jgi:phosphatidylglycerol lysyltransferase
MRAVGALGIAAIFLWLLARRLEGIDPAEILAALSTVDAAQWIAAAAATGASFAAIGRHEVVICRHLGVMTADEGAVRRSGMAGVAIGQTLGLGVLTGALVRWHVSRHLTLGQASAVSATVALSFVVGWAVLVAVVALVLDSPPGRGWGVAALAVAAAAVAGLLAAGSRAQRRGGIPNAFTLFGALGFVAVDLVAVAFVLHLLCPPELGLAFGALLPAFLIAYGAGVVSGTPGGVGVFEVTLVAMLPQTGVAPLMAAVVAWRVLYFALPALIGGIAAAFASTDRRGPQKVGRGGDQPIIAPLRRTRAEAGLVRQGHLETLFIAEGVAAIAGRTPHALVVLGDPIAPKAGREAVEAALRALVARAGNEARRIAIYKCGARTAAMARGAGMRALPVAREAWIAADRFDLSAPARAGLRRKLRKASAAGVTVRQEAAPDMAELAALAAAWAGARGGERGFSMGRFEPGYVGGQRVYVARVGARAVGFATFHAEAHPGAGEMTLDLMRPHPDAPEGTMHALVAQAIADAAAAGIARLSLAAVPEPGCGLPGVLGAWFDKIAGIFGAGAGAEGLRQFKAGFAPQWERLYILAPSLPALVVAGAEIARAVIAPAALPARGADRRAVQLHHEHYGIAGGDGAWQMSAGKAAVTAGPNPGI